MARAQKWKSGTNSAVTWDGLAFESERLLEQLNGRNSALAEEIADFPEGKTRVALIRARVNQDFFRAAVLASYDARCCITRLPIAPLLTASHIVPWSVLTVTPDLKVKLSPRVKRNPTEKAAREFLGRFESVSISPPRRFAPNRDFMLYHNEKIFLAT